MVTPTMEVINFPSIFRQLEASLQISATRWDPFVGRLPHTAAMASVKRYEYSERESWRRLSRIGQGPAFP
jgi:hypothetical protein